ncbi:MAG TPA: peptidase, partial [Enterococcus sp.]|nr:peptidase [Enterococcus sp.]
DADADADTDSDADADADSDDSQDTTIITVVTNNFGGSGPTATPKLPVQYSSSGVSKPSSMTSGSSTPKMYPKTSDTIGSSASWLGGLVSLISGLGTWKMKKSKKKQ